MRTFPLEAFEPEAPSPLQVLYETHGFSTVHSIEENVRLIAQQRIPGHRDPRSLETRRRDMAKVLCDWYIDAELDCSTAYAQLKSEQPEVSKRELNADPELFALNTLRRAIRHQRGIYTH